MEETFEKNCELIKKIFTSLSTQKRYEKLIELGQSLIAYPEELKTPERVVKGCQSVLYLAVEFQEGKLFFKADADALISKGLAALLIMAYSGLPPETLLTCPPTFITELGLTASLSPNRSNGLAHIHLKMKQEALNFIVYRREMQNAECRMQK